MSKTRCWRAFERLGGGAVMHEWRRELGPELERARGFLQLSNETADTYPCTNPGGCGYPHRIEEGGRELWVAVCDPEECCPPITVNSHERLLFRADVGLLCDGIARAIGLQRPAVRKTTRARAERVGTYGAVGAEVYLMFPSDSAWMAREVERLFGAQPDPFVLLTPTGIHCSAEVDSAMRRQLCMHIALRDILDLAPSGVLTARESARQLFAEFTRRLGEKQGLSKVVERIGRDIEAVARGNYELRNENHELKRLQADGYLKFALRVDGEDFRSFAVIMALGNRKAAAEFLGIPFRTFYDRVDRWAALGKEYQKMARAVEWRKKVGRRIAVPLGEAMQSGEAGETPDNPETLKETMARLRDNEVDNRDYPALLGEILAALESLNVKNWPTVREELIGIIRDELPQ